MVYFAVIEQWNLLATYLPDKFSVNLRKIYNRVYESKKRVKMTHSLTLLTLIFFLLNGDEAGVSNYINFMPFLCDTLNTPIRFV